MSEFSLYRIMCLLEKANDHEVNVSFSEGALSVQVKKGSKIDQSFLEELKANKPLLIHYFKNYAYQKKDSPIAVITKFDRNKVTAIPLSFSQERLRFIHQLEGSSQYHLPKVLKLKGKVNKEVLEHALQSIVNRHEVLRTVIIENEDVYSQLIKNNIEWRLNIADRSDLKNEPEALDKFILELISEPFDLTNDYMMRATLINLTHDEAVLVVVLHHIASDGWSVHIIVKEVVEFYTAYLQDRSPNLLPIKIQYADYAVWQRNHLQGSVLEHKISYWKNKLSNIEPLELPFDFPRPFVQSSKGTLVEFVIPKILTEGIQQLCQQERTTLFMTLLAAFKVMLYRYSGQQDICVGTPIAGRQQEEVEGLIGFFVNTLALRTTVNAADTFTTLLAEVKNTTMDAYEHQEAPFEKVVEAVIKDRDLGRSPLFQVMFILQNTPDVPELALPGLTLSEEVPENHTSKFDLTFYITETANGLQCSVEYCKDLFKVNTISRLIGHYKNLLTAIVQSPQQKIGLLPMLSKAEQRDIIHTLSGPTTVYESAKTLVDLFEAQASSTPQSVAVVFETDTLTYQQLNDRSNQLANCLRNKNVQMGDVVPICMNRSAAMVTGILGILKAGGTYVPIDAAYPEERINYILEDTKATILLTNKAFASSFSINTNAKGVCVDDELVGSYPSTKPTIVKGEEGPACIIYTSGSTGRPKGVLLSHAGIINRLEWMYKSYPFEPNEKNAIKTSIGFVDHIWELFGALCAGIPSVIFPKETLLDLDLLIDELSKQKITRWVLVPSLLKTLLNKLQEDSSNLPLLKYWTSSGEALSYELVKVFYQQFPATNHTLLNIYGSSEVTADVSCYDTSISFRKSTGPQHQQVPIGKPISNTSLYLLDEQQQLVAQGVTGEIGVGGIQVAQGYFNLPALTAERFINDPFRQQQGAKIFRTGDYGRLLEDGNIVYLGRIDDQVKIRGNRVELGEIEIVLRKQDQIRDCVIIAKTDSEGNNNLIGYLVAESPIDQQSLTTILREQLPDYMVPVSWVQLDTLPLTASGKIDKRALPDATDTARLVKTYTAPTTALEAQLASIWQQLLKKEQIGLHDNFFELGGHSLLAMRVVSVIRKALSIELSIKQLFIHPTIALLAKYLTGKTGIAKLPSIEVKNRPEHIPLSFSQERLWFIDQMDGSLQYHIPAVLRLKGELDVIALDGALQQVVNRHEVLRTMIVTEAGKGYQIVQPAGQWRLSLTDVSSYQEDEAGLHQLINQLIESPFNLSKDYMLRATLLIAGHNENILVVTLHHIASDGWSASILMNELAEGYNAAVENRAVALPVLPIQYADFTIWQRTHLKGDAWDRKQNYWKEKLDAVATLQLPTDYQRPLLQSSNGAVAVVSIDKKLAGRLQDFSQQEEATLFMTLFAAFNVLLYRYSGQTDICVGTPIAGRQHQETEGLIGFFVNTLAIRSELEGEMSFKNLLKQVKITTLDGYDHQEVPFEKVVKLVVKERDMSRTPLFQVVFALQPVVELDDLRLGRLELSREIITGKYASKFELSFIVTETIHGLNLVIEYCTDLFSETTILRMANHFNNLLESILSTPNRHIGELKMLKDAEVNHLITELNNTEKSFPHDKTIVHLFEEQVKRNPAAVALVFEEVSLTYHELNQKANSIAQYLTSKGVGKESLVPVCMNRSIILVTSLLGILKAGGAYVPIDPAYPADRIGFMLDDARAKIVLTTKDIGLALPRLPNVELVDADAIISTSVSQPADNLKITIGARQLAYVIYTSGSTGKPKGVMIEHQALANLIFWHKDAYQVTDKSRATAMAGIGFDAFGWELWPYLAFGAGLYLVDDDTRLNPSKLVAQLRKQNITHSFIATALIPGLINEIADKRIGLKYLLTGGDKLPAVETQRQYFKLVNNYGPTESTVVTSYYELISGEHAIPPIGKPIANTVIYLLNDRNQLVPEGAAGEICIGGTGLARGYLNLPDLTKQQFISDPFSTMRGARLYKSGDLGRWLPDGNLEYLGRVDEQVKIRGYRVELGEIEQALQASGLIQQSIVTVTEDKQGNKNLVGYVISGSEFSKDAIIAYLKEKLPDYMIPAKWVAMERFPLTANGKVNRKALPEPDCSGLLTTQYIIPFTSIQEDLVRIWKGLLLLERIGINDNFFELGGHSLMAMQVVSAIRNEMEIELAIKDLFFYSTVATLATHIEKQKKGLLIPAIIIQQRPELIPLSFSQERLWFIDQVEGSVQYHFPVILRFKGELNKEALLHALQTIIDRHEILRTVIREVNGNGHQFVQPKGDWQLSLTDGTAYSKNADALKLYIDNLTQTPFDLSNDYPVRGTLIRLSPEENILAVTMHHIASDAWSISIIVREVVELYNSYLESRAAILPDLPLQYADYAVWQRNYLQGEVLEKKTAYWKQKLEGLSALQLPTDFTRPSVRGTKGAAAGFRIDKQLTTQLQELSRQQGASLFMVLLSVFKVLLQRYSGQQDISVGTSIASRQQKELEGLIGFFVNTLTLRDEVTATATFTELLQQVKQTTLEAYENQEIPFEKVVETVVTERDMSRSPLFQVMLVLQNTPEASKLTLGEVALSAEPVATNISKFDITFFINETAEGLQGKVEYRTDLYEAVSIARMVVHFENLLRAVVNNPQETTGGLPMLKTEEQLQLLAACNDSAVEYPTNKSMVDLFEAQVASTPENEAIVFEDEMLSYRQLNERSNQLAHYLQSKGITKDSLVPLYVERSAAMMVAMLGIMKAGAAYVPIDTDFPQDRISYMLKDTGATIIVSSEQSIDNLPATGNAQIITIDGDELLHQPISNPAVKPSANQLAYVIYTSGSTGKPKGVMIEHQSLLDYYYGLNKHTQIDQSKSFALVSTIATDLGNTVIYGALLSGGTLHVFTKESVSNIEYLHDYFLKNRIDCLKIVPSHWKALINHGDFLLPKKLLVFGGEALPSDLVADIQLSGSPCRVVNHYGPTETTIGKLLHVTEPGRAYNKTVPVGKPFSNTNVYVLSSVLQLCPTGIPGQLYIAGDGLARGYHNNAALTTEKFLPDPFQPGGNNRMYGTGDLVKWLPDGNIEFLGRVDDQVKIRGYRIELGEIEAALQQCEWISQVVVLAREDKQGDKRLVAYIVPANDFDKESINAYLKEILPEYMIPPVLIKLESLPLTANGKVDRKALPDPETIESTTAQYTAPRNETEAKLAAIWEDILEVEQVGRNNDFFELGGHSLLAVRLVSAIRKAFGVEMPIGDIFDYPTVALLAKQLPNHSGETVLPAIEKVSPKAGRIPLSFSQERLWFIDQLDGSLQYHIPAVLRLKGRLNIAALSNAIQQIINRHEILRTVLPQQEGLAYQMIRDISKYQLLMIDGAIYQDDSVGLHQYIKQCIDRPFNLAADDMLRVSLVRINENEHILVAILHHIASDGWSAAIMVNELVELYNAFAEHRPAKLKPLSLQYSDYAIWQRTYLVGEVLAKKVGYWKKQLSGLSPLQLHTDRSRPAIQTTVGSIKAFTIDKHINDQLLAIGKQHGATLFMTLLSAFKVLLYRYSGQEDICVGTPVAGRQQQEIEGLIGFFVNTVAIRSVIRGHDSFIETLKQVRATTLEAYAHQEVPFEKVVEAVVTERDLGRSPVFQVMFVLQNTPAIPALMLGDVEMTADKFDHTVSMFDLSLSIKEEAHGLSGHLEYCSDLFDEDTILRMINHYIHLLQSIVARPLDQAGWLPMLTNDEQQRLLKTFNNSAVDYPKNTTVIGLFEEQVRSTPNKIALFFEEQQLSYDLLNKRSNQMARFLKSKGVGQNSFVPLCINRSVDMIVSILGILKAGGVYVPVDPDYPAERIAHMLSDTAAVLVLATKENQGQLMAQTGIEIVEVDCEWEMIAKHGEENLLEAISPRQLAYIIYTSGSTGTPKGVMIEHASLLNYVQLVTRYFSISAEDNIIQQSSPSFDTLVEEIYPALTTGASLHIVREGGRDIAGIKKLIEGNAITILTTTPMVVEYLNKELTRFGRLRYLIVGGDVLYPSYITNFFGKVKIVNGYGPSETTVCATYNTVESVQEATVIGRPIDNAMVYILSREGQLVPEGVSGEICVAGAGLARGYLNNPELTEQKFIPNPFEPGTGSKIYKTGDAGRWLPSGKIDYLGRIDEQVKIRGYRVELAEIQHVLLQSSLVSDAVVLAKNDAAGHKRLVGYIVAVNDHFDKEAVQSFLSSKLPDFMIPSVWVKLDSFPLTPNGKLDKKALPDPAIENVLKDQYTAPRNEWEEQLAVIWQDLLGVPKVGVDDNFFELGGDSILTIQLVSRANRLGYSLQARDIFLYQDIARLSKAVAQRSGHAASGEQDKLTGAAGLLPIQQWYLQTTAADLSHYNQAVLLSVDKMLDAAILDRAFTQLVLHHDALRLKFHRENGEWKQEYGDHQPTLIVEDLQSTGKQIFVTSITELADHYHQQLDIEKGVLVKMIWIQTPVDEASNRLLIIVHHLAIDGVSWRILLEDLDILITGFSKGAIPGLGKKSSSYRQWFQSLDKYRHTDHLIAQTNYWKIVEEGYVPIPVDKEFTATLKVNDLISYKSEMNEMYTGHLLKDISKAYNTNINDILLSALTLTFCDYCNRNNMVIGLEGHGREDIEKDMNTSRTIGWFTTLYPVLLEVDPARNIPATIKGIKEKLRAVPDKGIGYGVLKYIDPAEPSDQPVCWDLLFNYLGQSDNIMGGNQWMSLAGESVGTVKSKTHPVNEKLTVTGWVQAGRLAINWEYSDQHFLKETVIGLAQKYLANLEAMIAHCLDQQKAGSVYTPSDYGLGSDISVEELDSFLEDEETDNIISF